MLNYALKRLGVAILVAITVSMVTFSLLHLTGDPAMALAGESATEEDIENIRRVYGYDRPFLVQYADWLGKALTGDFGRSHYLKTEVADVVFQRLPTTMILGASAIAFAFVLAIPLGVLAAIKPNTVYDRLALTIAVVGQALPSFWFALIMIFWLGIEWRLLPISGTESWRNFIMPAIALGYYVTPAIMRLTRAGMLEVLASDYIRTARAKGLPERTVVWKHALRNALIPLVTLWALNLSALLGGAVVTESIFSWPGLGPAFLVALSKPDLDLILGFVMLTGTIVVLFNLIADILYGVLDPRIRFD